MPSGVVPRGTSVVVTGTAAIRRAERRAPRGWAVRDPSIMRVACRIVLAGASMSAPRVGLGLGVATLLDATVGTVAAGVFGRPCNIRLHVTAATVGSG